LSAYYEIERTIPRPTRAYRTTTTTTNHTTTTTTTNNNNNNNENIANNDSTTTTLHTSTPTTRPNEQEGKVDMIIHRTLPNNQSEDWHVRDLILEEDDQL
jgi:hypothetical protein